MERMTAHGSLALHHITTTISEPGGHSYTVPSLCAALASLGDELTLHTLAPASADPAHRYTLRAHPRSGILSAIGGSRSMKEALRSAAASGDVLHSHGMWRMPTIYPLGAIRGTNCRLVVSPRGTLDPWAFRHRATRKRPVWYAGQRANLARADCLHATAEQEYRFIRDQGFRAPVMLVPNGVELPSLDPRPPRAAGRRRLLFLARVHPKKGVDVLLRAWRNVQDRHEDWEVRVVGADDGGYLGQMRKLVRDLGARRVTFTGYVPERAKADEYRAADLYVLPTHNENWGVSIADALSYGVPAIVGRGAPWSELDRRNCGWWIDNDLESVTACLGMAMSLDPEELSAKGRRGREWIGNAFPWRRIAEQTRAVYRWLVDGGGAPACVRMD